MGKQKLLYEYTIGTAFRNILMIHIKILMCISFEHQFFFLRIHHTNTPAESFESHHVFNKNTSTSSLMKELKLVLTNVDLGSRSSYVKT